MKPGLQYPICAPHGTFQMPILCEGELSVDYLDYLDDGAGPAVVLVHSSVSGSKQWRRPVAALSVPALAIAKDPGRGPHGTVNPWRDRQRQNSVLLGTAAMTPNPSIKWTTYTGLYLLKAANVKRLRQL